MGQPALGTVSKDFEKLIEKVSHIVHKISGNRLGEKQAYMVETRVKKRMMELGFKSADEYIKFIDQNVDKESHVLVGLITTHHTFFFREYPHFEILKSKLPELVSEVKKRGDKTVMVWSAACSRGHEVYSLAMFLNTLLPEIDPSISFKIIGTDIDQESVKVANNGVYHQNEIKEIPMTFMNNNWAKGSGEIEMFAKVKSHLKSKCEFKPGNLLKMNESIGQMKFDVIFCRNVFIYFESHQVESISKDILGHLNPHGIYFSGISEPLSGLKLEVQSIGPSAYIHKAAAYAAKESSPFKNQPSLKIVPEKGLPVEEKLIKVLCVDDSPSIHTLLKKILSKENGFEIMGTAMNGAEAVEKLKTMKVDVVTLDIHMPIMDGITYLEKHFTSSHPPVMIISSASRADSDTAMKAFKYGASDYVEKPALINLEERGDEIRTKLRSLSFIKSKKIDVSSFDKENQMSFKINLPENKLRILAGSFSDLNAVKQYFKDLDNSQPPSLFFIEGMGEILESVVNENQKDFKKNVVFLTGIETRLEPNTIYIGDLKKLLGDSLSKHKALPISINVFNSVSEAGQKLIRGKLSDCPKFELLLEDGGEKNMSKNILKIISHDVVPATSFAYMSCRFLSK